MAEFARFLKSFKKYMSNFKYWTVTYSILLSVHIIYAIFSLFLFFDNNEYSYNFTKYILGMLGFIGLILIIISKKRFSNSSNNEEMIQKLKRFQDVLDKNTIVAVTDTNGKILEVNEMFCTISGYSREELIGKDHRILNSGTHPKKFFKEMWQTISSGKTWYGEITNKKKNSDLYYVSTVIIPLQDTNGTIDRYLSVRYDITDRVQYENQNRLILNSLNIGVWSYNPQTHQINWDNNMHRIFEVEINQVLRQLQDWFEILKAPDTQKLFRENLDSAIKTNKELDITLEFSFGSEQKKYIKVIGLNAYDIKKQPITFHGICLDVTKEIEVEKKLQTERNKSILNSKLASLGEMSAGIAHEINNPLSVVIGTLPMLDIYKDDPDKFKAKIEIIKRASSRISKIVQSLKRFSRSAESSPLELGKLSDIIREVLIMVEGNSIRHSTPITLEIQSETPIMCNLVEIEQVIINLISNSIDAVKNLQVKWVKVVLFEKDDELTLQIIDSGEHIPKEIEAKIFEPFFTTKPLGEGTGLGLSISRGIIQQHNGTLEINRSMSNTCFEIKFKTQKLEIV